MEEAPITTAWLAENGFVDPFKQPQMSCVNGKSFWVKYVHGWHAIAVRFEPRNQKWQWQMEEHRDNLNWDDKYMPLPGSCQPQTIGHACHLLAVLSGKF